MSETPYVERLKAIIRERDVTVDQMAGDILAAEARIAELEVGLAEMTADRDGNEREPGDIFCAGCRAEFDAMPNERGW